MIQILDVAGQHLEPVNIRRDLACQHTHVTFIRHGKIGRRTRAVRRCL